MRGRTETSPMLPAKSWHNRFFGFLFINSNISDNPGTFLHILSDRTGGHRDKGNKTFIFSRSAVANGTKIPDLWQFTCTLLPR